MIHIPTSKIKNHHSKRLKHNNIICYIDGKCFRSKLEAKFYSLLLLRKKIGEIFDFECQVVVHIPPLILAEENGIKATKCVVDFVVTNLDGTKDWIDTKGRNKGVQYDLFKLKKKMVKFFYGIDIIEVYKC